MATGDIFRFINTLDDASVDRIGGRLEFRGSDATFVGLRDRYFAQLPLTTARSILALGCGTGVELRALAKIPGIRARLVGVDHSPRLIETARRLTADEHHHVEIEYLVGDAHALDLPAAGFDIVIMHTLLSHVTDPVQVLREAARVTRPGGSVAVFDGDYASLTIPNRDPALSAPIAQAFLTAVVNNPWVMRDMPRMLHEAGFQLTEGSAFAFAELGSSGFFANLADAYAPMLVHTGLVSAEEVERWLTDIRQSISDNTFFGASNYYTYLAERTAV